MWRQHRFHATFSVVLLILVHVLTIGVISPFLVARKYTFLPVVRHDDFSTARAAGFLFIPFFGFYWVFVLCQRIVARLTLQSRLWNVPGAPSRGLATTLAACWVASAIPYLGLVFWFPLQFVLWPIYLVQIQRFCNRLALEAAPPEARSSMVGLEGAMRLRWIGWIILVPCLVLAVTSLVVAVVSPVGPVDEMIAGIVAIIGVAGGGVYLLYLGGRGTAELQASLERLAPSILAGYLRIDKNAAWTVAALAIPLGLLFVVAGAYSMNSPAPDAPGQEAVPSIVLGATVGLGAGYAVLRARQLRQHIARLADMQPSRADSGSVSW